MDQDNSRVGPDGNGCLGLGGRFMLLGCQVNGTDLGSVWLLGSFVPKVDCLVLTFVKRHIQ